MVSEVGVAPGSVTVIVADRDTQVKANVALLPAELTKERIKKLVGDLEKTLAAL